MMRARLVVLLEPHLPYHIYRIIPYRTVSYRTPAITAGECFAVRCVAERYIADADADADRLGIGTFDDGDIWT